jgi:hypothetical protein
MASKTENEAELEKQKGADQRNEGERYGRPAHGPATHPYTKKTGRKGASNAGEDETSGSE